MKNREIIARLPQEAQLKPKDTVQYIKALLKEKYDLNSPKNELIARSLQDAIPHVAVMHFIYHSAVLKIGKSRRVISSVLEGPLRFYEENDHITVEPYSEKRQKKNLIASPLKLSGNRLLQSPDSLHFFLRDVKV